MDIRSKKLELFEQNKVEGLSGWDPFQKRAIGVWWGSVSGKSYWGAPLLSSMWMKCALLSYYEYWFAHS
jgi:L-asparagine transporter-like permease